MIRKKIQFYGRVQGVGFRFHAQYAAEALGLTGWVRNENDGSVRMEVQGAEELIDRMLLTFKEDRLRSHMRCPVIIVMSSWQQELLYRVHPSN